MAERRSYQEGWSEGLGLGLVMREVERQRLKRWRRRRIPSEYEIMRMIDRLTEEQREDLIQRIIARYW